MKKFVKSILLSVFSVALVIVSIFGIASSLRVQTKVQAAEVETWQTGVFEMEDGVSLKLSEKSGLRFIVKMDETVNTFLQENDDAEVGFVIAPEALMKEANGDYINMPKKVGGVADKAKIYNDGDYYYANACITNLQFNSFEYDFVAIAYIKYGDEIRYTDYNDYARNNLYDVVNMSVLNGYAKEVFSFETYKGWYGSELFPIVVENTSEYDAIVDVVNEEAIDLSSCTLVVKGNATPTHSFATEAYKPNIISNSLYTVNALIEALPSSITMPEAIGMIARIREVEAKYNALVDADKAKVKDYAKVESLLVAIDGYDRVYKNDAYDGTVIPSCVPNYTSVSGGSATTRTDDLYGNVLSVSSAQDGKAQLYFENFPSVEKYATIYFYVKVDVACNLYVSDGITNDGWGDNWKNTWSVNGFWCNANTWRLVELNVSDGYIGTNFAVGFRADNPGFSFEISDFYGIVKEKIPTTEAQLTLGVMADTGTTNEYGKVYNLSQGQWFVDNNVGNTMHNFAAGALASALPSGYAYFEFWMYNPTDTEYNFHLAGDVSGTWTDSKDSIPMAAKTWTKITISAADIELNKNGVWYLYILGGDGAGAAAAGWQVSTVYAVKASAVEASLAFGQMTNTGTTNEHGKVYNLATQWGGDTDFQFFDKNVLSSALTDGHDSFYFWIYNPNASDVTMELVNTESWKHYDVTTLKAGAWTKYIISAEAIEENKTGGTVCCVSSGASTAGWQISAIFKGPEPVQNEIVYLDHADVKNVIALINAIPESVTMNDVVKVEAARAAYDKLESSQQLLVSNIAKLTSAEAFIADSEKANAVIALIDAINPRAVEKSAVEAARAAYDNLTDTQKGYVTNYADLEAYEAEIEAEDALAAQVSNVNTLIANLPDSVLMPDHLVFVSRIEAAKAAYDALSDEGKGGVENYAKLRTLVASIRGYETVHIQTVEGVNVIPSHVPNFTSTIGGTASMGYDAYYGDYLRVTPNAGGKASIQFINFPDVSMYSKIYFNIRVVGESCNVYISDGITNDGWGDNWHNNWSMDGYWANNGNWIQKEVAVSTGMISSNWALGLRAGSTDVSFEITNIIGYAPDLGTKTMLTFGNFADSGTANEYGTVYNFTQGWSSDTDLGAFNAGALKGALAEGHDSLQFWMYNPTDSALNFNFTGDANAWAPSGEYVTALAPKAWTKVVVTPEIIAGGDSATWFVTVASGAGTAGWQISPIYSFSSTSAAEDNIDKVQDRIDALDTAAVDEYQVQLAREAYEALPESEKSLITIAKLIECETALYGDVADAPFIVNGNTSYKIYIDQGNANTRNAIRAASSFMNEQLQAATTVPALTVIDDTPSSMTKYRYAIVFGYSDLYESLSGEDLLSGYGENAYQVVKVGRTVFILANTSDGYHMGALAFLRETIGYDMISEDCIAYNRAADTLPELDVYEVPSFEYRQQQTYLTEDEVYGMGLASHSDLWISSEKGWDMHNTLQYLPTETYRSEHSSWYYDYTDSAGIGRTQICPTAGGSSTEFAAMVQTIADRMMIRINMYPTIENISFSIMDTADNDDCNCNRCKLYDTLYGEGGFAAAWIDLMNAVNAEIRTRIGDRKLNIAFLAYRGTEKAPANDDYSLKQRYVINDDGSYALQTDENGNPVYLKCDKGVTVWLAPINALYAENFNHADNATHLATIKKWCALSDSVYLWMYGTNFKYYMYPYNTWKASAENYKILADLGVKAVWSQSHETEATAFTDLKSYIDSKFMFNVNADYETVLNTYFTRYFGAAATSMRAMFDQIVEKCEAIEAENDGLGRGIYDDLEYETGTWFWAKNNTYWSEDELNALVTLCNEAKAAVNADSSLTEAEKTAIINRITRESLFPRYVLCTIYENTSDRAAFKADCTALGLTLYREADGLLSDLYSEWGV